MLVYKDHGLAATNNANDPKLDRIREDIIALCKEGLSIAIEINSIETDFLDVIFNLAREKYFPFETAHNTPLHINFSSSHSLKTIKQLPKIINKKISDLSCNKEKFDQVKSINEK